MLKFLTFVLMVFSDFEVPKLVDRVFWVFRDFWERSSFAKLMVLIAKLNSFAGAKSVKNLSRCTAISFVD